MDHHTQPQPQPNPHTRNGLAKLRARLQELGIADQQILGDGLIDTTDVVMRCDEPEVWRLLIWVSQKAISAAEHVGERPPCPGDEPPCDVISASSAEIASLIGAIKRLRRVWGQARAEGKAVYVEMR